MNRTTPAGHASLPRGFVAGVLSAAIAANAVLFSSTSAIVAGPTDGRTQRLARSSPSTDDALGASRPERPAPRQADSSSDSSLSETDPASGSSKSASSSPAGRETTYFPSNQ